MSKDDSMQRQSLNHCFVPATILPAERAFSTVSALSSRTGFSWQLLLSL
jgi:hypothetical protein